MYSRNGENVNEIPVCTSIENVYMVNERERVKGAGRGRRSGEINRWLGRPDGERVPGMKRRTENSTHRPQDRTQYPAGEETRPRTAGRRNRRNVKKTAPR